MSQHSLALTKEIALSRRKTGAMRSKEQDTRFTQPKTENMKTFYMHESKTIDFSQAQREQKARPRKPVTLIPKSLNQEKYIMALLNDETDVVVVSGPAGTGKTYLAMLAAIKALRAGECEQIVLTRPAVTVEDEKHGFLPGDLNQKMEPWTRPLLDVLKEHYPVKEITQMLDEQIIEISPLAFMRGRTFKRAWIIADEMQNATPNQMKMLLTRIGEGSKIVVTGDIEQTDKRSRDNGLMDLGDKLNSEAVKGIELCKFDTRDIQRHELIGRVLKMYS